MIFLPFHFLHASTSSALKAFKKGDYSESETQYRKAWEKKKDHDALNFNLGDATYKTQKYDEAENLFQRALSSPNLQLQEEAYYNLGNTQYRLGEKTEKEDHQKTIERWQQAVQSYESALKLNPKDEDAKYNLEFVKKKLEQQKQKQDQQNQQNQDQKNQQQNQSNSQNQQNQNKQDQNQQEKNQNQQNQQNQNQQNKDQQNKDQQKSDQEKQQQNQQNQEQKKNEDQNQQKKNQKNESSQSENQKKQNQQPQQQQGAPEERRKPGQMSKEEAEQLLNALKDEQGQPSKAQQIPLSHPEEPDRDW